jgi:hypothetical protein
VVSCTSLPTSPIFQLTYSHEQRHELGGVDRVVLFRRVVKLFINSRDLGIFSSISRSRYLQQRLQFLYHVLPRHRRTQKRRGNR